MKRVLLILSHSIEEYDQVRLLSGLGYEVFSLGGYINPHEPHDPKRPALPDVPHFSDLHDVVDREPGENNIGRASEHVPDEILEWLGPDGIIIAHHYLERIYAQWDHLREWRAAGGRVIWRTVGQSVENNERIAAPYREDGLEVVRYSPKEENIPGYCGRDALIRFYKDPEEYCGWTGDSEFVTNVTQELQVRHPFTNYEFYEQATDGLLCHPAGPGSEHLPGGLGTLTEEFMQQLLRDARAYLYCGTQPASYTLGLLEALMTGTPVVSIGPSHMQIFPYGSELYEGHELAPLSADTPAQARNLLEGLLGDADLAASVSQHQRWRTSQEFGMEKVGAAWRDFLGAP